MRGNGLPVYVNFILIVAAVLFIFFLLRLFMDILNKESARTSNSNSQPSCQPPNTSQSNQTSRSILDNSGHQKFSSEFHFESPRPSAPPPQSPVTSTHNKNPQECDKPPDFEEAMKLMNSQNKK